MVSWRCGVKQTDLMRHVIQPAFVRVAVFNLGSTGVEDAVDGAGAMRTGEPVILVFALCDRLPDLGAADDAAIVIIYL